MAKSKIDLMREMAAEIQRRNEEFAKTPEGEDFDIQMEFATKLLKTMKTRRMTKTDLCERIGMKAPQFTKIIQGEANVTITMIGRIAKGVGVPPSRLMPNKLAVGVGK
jgi:antitoxin component HigA of HigAB toxin-antitoxin module